MRIAVWIATARFAFWRRAVRLWPCGLTFDYAVCAHRDRAWQQEHYPAHFKAAQP